MDRHFYRLRPLLLDYTNLHRVSLVPPRRQGWPRTYGRCLCWYRGLISLVYSHPLCRNEPYSSPTRHTSFRGDTTQGHYTDGDRIIDTLRFVLERTETRTLKGRHSTPELDRSRMSLRTSLVRPLQSFFFFGHFLPSRSRTWVVVSRPWVRVTTV